MLWFIYWNSEKASPGRGRSYSGTLLFYPHQGQLLDQNHQASQFSSRVATLLSEKLRTSCDTYISSLANLISAWSKRIIHHRKLCRLLEEPDLQIISIINVFAKGENVWTIILVFIWLGWYTEFCMNKWNGRHIPRSKKDMRAWKLKEVSSQMPNSEIG
jgi:hypothetical protein